MQLREGKHAKKPAQTMSKKKRTNNPLEKNKINIRYLHNSVVLSSGSVQHGFHCLCFAHNETLAVISSKFFVQRAGVKRSGKQTNFVLKSSEQERSGRPILFFLAIGHKIKFLKMSAEQKSQAKL